MDTIIVGGGIAGLTAATYLARAKKKVLVLERSKDLGGRARTENDGGFFLNLGAHALYRGGAAQAVLAELGVPTHGHYVAGTGAYAIAGGKLHTLPSGPLSLITTGLLSLGAKLEVARVLGTLGKEAKKLAPEQTLAEWTAQAAADPAARSLVEMLARIATYGSDPSSLSAIAGVRQIATALQHGVEYVDGGWSTLVGGLTEAAKKAGVRFESSARVTKVGDGVTLEDGRHLSASTVILTVSPKDAAAMFSGAAHELLADFAARAVPAVAACLDIGLSSLPKPKSFAAFGTDQPIYVSVHSKVAKLAPDGSALLHCLKYLDPHAPQDAAADERELEDAVELLQPGWRSAIVKKRFLPRMTVMNALIPPAKSGAPHRPGIRFPGTAENVFFAGDWITSDNMLADTSFASAKQAAHAALALLEKHEARAA
jgi:phytoene dehydrogenase-like protein